MLFSVLKGRQFKWLHLLSEPFIYFYNNISYDNTILCLLINIVLDENA